MNIRFLFEQQDALLKGAERQMDLCYLENGLV